MNEHIVIQGSGLTALVVALKLASLGLGKNTVLVDGAAEPGGHLRSRDFGAFGSFDIGMHNLQETGDPELDELIFSLLPSRDWNRLEGNARDLAGHLIGGRVATNSPYIDVRPHTKDIGIPYAESFIDWRLRTEYVNAADAGSAGEYLDERFGYFGNPYRARLESRYGVSAEELAPLACFFTPMDRVVAAEEAEVALLYRDALWRRLLAWPNQRSLPKTYSSGRDSYYPRHGGIQTWTDAAIGRLRAQGVTFLNKASITALTIKDQSITELKVDRENQPVTFRTAAVFWTASRKPLLDAIAATTQKSPESMEPRLVTWICHLRLRHYPSQLADLHYLFDYDPNHVVHRLTNYVTYCPESESALGFPFTVELLDHEDLFANAEEVVGRVLHDLTPVFGERSPSDFTFLHAEKLKSGFPLPSITSVARSKNDADLIEQEELKNSLLLGIQTHKSVFFQGDVLRDAKDSMDAWLSNST